MKEEKKEKKEPWNASTLSCQSDAKRVIELRGKDLGVPGEMERVRRSDGRKGRYVSLGRGTWKEKKDIRREKRNQNKEIIETSEETKVC